MKNNAQLHTNLNKSNKRGRPKDISKTILPLINPNKTYSEVNKNNNVYYSKGTQKHTVIAFKETEHDDIRYTNEKIAIYNIDTDKLIVYNPSSLKAIDYNKIKKICNKLWNLDLHL